MKQISEKQRQEWTENPTTLELLKLIEKELKEILETPTANCLFYGEPVKTHEALVGQDSKAFLYALFISALNGDWSYFEEIEDE